MAREEFLFRKRTNHSLIYVYIYIYTDSYCSTEVLDGNQKRSEKPAKTCKTMEWEDTDRFKLADPELFLPIWASLELFEGLWKLILMLNQK